LATLLAAFLRFVVKEPLASSFLFPKRSFPFVFPSLKIDYANSLSLGWRLKVKAKGRSAKTKTS
jgi:hypothetical protein